MRTCPRCRKGFIRRSHRLGGLERLLSVFLVYPFRCQLCTYRFLAFQGRKVESRHREYERIPVRLPISFLSIYAGEQVKGDGTVVGLSIRGCALTSDHLLRRGQHLRLHLRVPQEEPPIEIAIAVVRSTVKERAGLEFLSIREEEDARLRRFVESLLQRKAF